jgi:hypothetical protein
MAGSFFNPPSSTKGNLTNRHPGNDSASNILYEMICQSQQNKKKQETEKAVKNLKVKTTDKPNLPPRREKEPISPDLLKQPPGEYQFATLQVPKTQREADRNKSNSGFAHSRQVLSP